VSGNDVEEASKWQMGERLTGGGKGLLEGEVIDGGKLRERGSEVVGKRTGV
jgi:hypothetical protein